jgi:hypothetical protein
MSIDLINDMNTKVAMLARFPWQRTCAERTRLPDREDYRIALAEKILIERDKGTPVTIISDVCRGDRKIARLKFERDVAEVVYKSALEAINILKLQVKVLDEQIGREWHRA